MTSPCPQRNTRTALTRTGALAVVFGIAFAPTLAYAQTGEPTTVRALIAGDGSVSSVERLPDGPAPSASDIPVKIGISQASEGDVTTTNYQVQNTSVQKKTVEYVGPDGLPATVEQDVALPLVAQLSVRLPASRTDVTAFGARITKLADGSSELVWSMVLFSPIGAPITDVSFSAKGKGEPIARLDVATVSPNSEQGLSATAQAANATVNGNGILGTVGTGASEGLTKLSEGVGKLLEGLGKLEDGAIKLNTGLVGAVDGAEQLATGGVAASKGAGDLSVGAGKLDAGANKLSDGLALISGGLNTLSAVEGLPKALAGAKTLAAGVDQLRAGLGAPATDGTILNGVAKISGGLGLLLDNPATTAVEGLPAAKGGVDQIKAGIETKILPGLGDPDVPGSTIRYAVEQVRLGSVDGSRTGGGADQLKALVDRAREGIFPSCPATSLPSPGTPATQSPCQAVNTALFGIDHPVGMLGAGDTGGLKQKQAAAAAALGGAGAGLSGIVVGLTNTTDPNLPPGIVPSLGAISGTPSNGPSQPGPDAAATGLSSAIEGVRALKAGVDGVDTNGDGVVDNGLTLGLNKIAAGLRSGDVNKPGIAEGLASLVSGLTNAVGGVQQLATGAGSAYTGSKDLAAGTGQIATGSTALAAGVKKIAEGNKKLSDGLPAAADGSGAIAEGLGAVITGETAVGQGLSDVNTKAVAVLQSQFKQGTALARQQLAGLDASTALVNTIPGAANTTWVLSQTKGDITARLASGENDSNMARNLGLGAGGVLLLLGGIAGGFVSGRKASVGA